MGVKMKNKQGYKKLKELDVGVLAHCVYDKRGDYTNQIVQKIRVHVNSEQMSFYMVVIGEDWTLSSIDGREGDSMVFRVLGEGEELIIKN